jgi:hypothetical protein
VEGCAGPLNCAGAGVPTNIWPKALGAVQMDPATSNAKADAERRPIRDIVHSLEGEDNGTGTQTDFMKLSAPTIAPNRHPLHGI